MGESHRGMFNTAYGAYRLVINKFIRYWRTLMRSYYNVRGKQTVSIANVNAEFRADSENHGERLRWHIDSEREIIKQFNDVINPDDTVYDIGAHIGLYSGMAAALVDHGSVHAFEPVPGNAEIVKRNIQLNGGNGVVHTVALSDSNSTVSMKVPENTGGATLGEANGKEISVPQKRGDDYIRENDIPLPNVVKIDVEGAELRVISGMKEILQSTDCRCIIIEIHPEAPHRSSLKDFGDSEHEVINTLQEIGFSLTNISLDNRTIDKYFIGFKN